MSAKNNKVTLNKRSKMIISGAVSLLVLFILIGIFGTPSAESVFRGMNEKMLEVTSVTVDQKLTMKGTAEISSSLYMDFNSSSTLLAKGDFSLSLTSDGLPMYFAGDLIKVGDNNFVRYSNISSTDPTMSPSLSVTESKLKNNWVKIRANDQFTSIASSPLEFTSSILPTPYANLNDDQRKNVLAILQDKSMYTINESSKVDTAGVSAYKYLISYNKDQYKKAAKLIASYNSYFKTDDTNSGNEITSMTIWVNISTEQIIKMEYIGTTESGDVTGSLSFSGYDQKQTVEKPGDYSIESELLN